MTKVKNTETDFDSDFRCAKCNKLLARQNSFQNDIEIKCKKCGTLNSFLDTIKEQVIITDIEGKILFVNESVHEITGYDMQEMIGNYPSLWGGQMSKEFYADMWNEIKEKKKTIVVGVINKKKSGELYNARLRISPTLNVDGEIEFFVGIETMVR